MRSFLFKASIISILTLFTGVITTFAIDVVGVLQPGDTLFAWQYFAEESHVNILGTSSEKAQHFIAIAQRRADDLRDSAGTQNELISIYYLNQSLDRAALALAKTQGKEAENLRSSFEELLLKT